MSEAVESQVADTQTDQVESPVIADQNAEPAPAAAEEKPRIDPVQRRIDKLTRDKYQTRAELEMTRRELETLRQQVQAPRQQAKQDHGEPKLEQFDNLDAYIAAKAAYVADQRLNEKLSERDRSEQERRQQESSAKAGESWSKKLADLRKEVPDYDEVIESADVMINNDVAKAVFESDMGPKVMLHLAQNPEEADTLNGLTGRALDRAIFRIEAKLESQPLANKQSSAPKPASPVGAKASVGKSIFDASYDEFAKMRQKQIASRRK